MTATTRRTATPFYSGVLGLCCCVAAAAVVWIIASTTAWLPWQQMCLLAVAIYAGLKILSLIEFLLSRSARPPANHRVARSIGYLLFWPGMDPRPFFAPMQSADRPRVSEWIFAIAKFFVGIALTSIAATTGRLAPFAAGWIGLIGLLFIFHFGLFHIFSVAWRHVGIDAAPIMQTPLFARSLADFWGKRWNLAFRDWAHTFVFKPSLRRFGAVAATLLVFVFSGVIHDVVISLPAGAGYGLPTAYFLLQAAGMIFERTQAAKHLGIGRDGVISRLYALVIVLAPAGMLFHRTFIESVVVPMLRVATPS